jgi:FkbM family methyltransferase
MVEILKKIIIAIYPRNWYLRTKLNNGAIILGKNKKGFGGRGAFLKGDNYEPELFFLDKFIEKDDVFIDVGANTGIYSMKAAKLIGENGLVIACEPFSGVFESLIKSVEVNGFNNIRLRNICIGAKKEILNFYLNYSKPNCFSLSKLDSKASSICIPVLSLDELIQWENIDKVNYIKIDAEGAENVILLGSFYTILNFRPIVQLETFDLEIKNKLSDYKFFKSINSPNVLCLPEEHKFIEIPETLGLAEFVN